MHPNNLSGPVVSIASLSRPDGLSDDDAQVWAVGKAALAGFAYERHIGLHAVALSHATSDCEAVVRVLADGGVSIELCDDAGTTHDYTI